MKTKKNLIIVFLILLSSFVSAGSVIWDDVYNFNSGTYYNTVYDNGLVLDAVFNGSYCSEIIYTNYTNTTWLNITIIKNDSNFITQIIGEDLPNLQGIDDTANMTNNILLYHLDELSGSVIDMSSNNKHGTRYNGVQTGVTGKFDNAYHFDGVNDYVDVPNLNEIKTAFTINTWIKGETNNFLINPMIFDFWDSSTDGVFLQVYTYKIRFRRNNNVLVSNTLLYENTWYMVTVTSDGNNAIIYLNGQPDGNTASPQNIDVTENARIGQNRLNGLNGFAGTIDELAVWNRSLSAQEVELLYNRTNIINNVTVNRSLNFSVRTCQNSTCIGSEFQYIENTEKQNLTLQDNPYFQFCANMSTSFLTESPIINNVTVIFSPYNFIINPISCNFQTDITLMYMDYPYIERGVSTVLGWRITKKNNPDVIITNITTARINVNGVYYNLTYNPATYNHEVTLLFNEVGDYGAEYPFRLYLKEDLSELCSFNWYNGIFRIRDFGNLTINIYENANKSKTFNEDFSNIIIEVANSEKLESDVYKSLLVPFSVVNNWFDYLTLKALGITLDMGNTNEYILNDEKVFHSELTDGQAVLSVPLEEKLIIKILGEKTSETLLYTNDGYSYMFYVPQNIKYNTDLTTLTLNSSSVIDISITQKDVNPNWYYFKIILIVGGILLITVLPYLVYVATGDYSQAMKFFTALLVAIPPTVVFIIFIGGFLK